MRTYEKSLAEAEELVKRHTDSVSGITDWCVYSDIAAALVKAYDEGREDENTSWLDAPLSEVERLKVEIAEARNEAATIRRAYLHEKHRAEAAGARLETAYGF